MPILEAARASPPGDYRGFELVSDTSLVDLRDWRSKSRDVAHYYRRLRVRRPADRATMLLQYPRLPFERVDFRAGPAKLNPVVRRVPPDAEGKPTWELAFDLSRRRAGAPIDSEIEAVVHDFEARKAEHENWLRYSPPADTELASVWVLFPEDRPYEDYRLVRFPADDPSRSQEIETQYTIDHPYGSIIAWSIVNAKPGYVYECEWTTSRAP